MAVKPLATPTYGNYQNIRDAQGTTQQQAVQDAYNGPSAATGEIKFNVRGPYSSPPVDLTSGSTTQETKPVGTPWSLEGDPVYQAAYNSGQSQFNLARSKAMYDVNAAQQQTAQDRVALDTNSTESRRRLAGNYAARGMSGGAAGAYSLAEAEANARQVAARTSLKDKLSALNANFLENYGATGTDWTGTLAGQGYKTQAAQAAITAQLAKYGVA
jgi:hypothetical protein